MATWKDYEGEFGLRQQCAVVFFAVIIGVFALLFLNLPGLAAGDSRYLYMPFTGTGFVVDTHHILTAAHVIEDCKRVVVRQGSAEWRAQVAAIDEANDLGLLRTETSFRRTAKFTNRQSLSLEELVLLAAICPESWLKLEQQKLLFWMTFQHLMCGIFLIYQMFCLSREASRMTLI